MSALALVMMIVAILIIRGGLVFSTVFLVTHPLSSEYHPLDDHEYDRYPEYEIRRGPRSLGRRPPRMPPVAGPSWPTAGALRARGRPRRPQRIATLASLV